MDDVEVGPVAPSADPVTIEMMRERHAQSTVNTYVAWAAGAALLPIPLIDVAAIGAIQLKMLYDLSKVYELPYSKSVGKAIIGSLVGGATPVSAGGPAASLVKMVPIIGNISAMFVQPALASATTYALGKVFIQHFASGGTFLDFKPERVRAHYETILANRAGKSDHVSASAV